MTDKAPGGEVKRYDWDMCQSKDGPLVFYSDFAELSAKLARVTEEFLAWRHEAHNRLVRALDAESRLADWYKAASPYATPNALKEGLAAAEADARRYLDAAFAMFDDGWLNHGPEGMDETQSVVYKIVQEHPEYKRRKAAALPHPTEGEG